MNVRASARCACAISASSALTSAPSRTTSSPPTTSRSTRCGPAKTMPATRSSAPRELEPVGAPHREVGALAGLERADVVAPEHGRAAAGAEPDRVPGRHRGAAAATARHEQRLLDLEEEVAALVRRRPVDAEADADAGVEHVPHGRHAGAEPEVRGGAVGDAGAARRELGDVGLGEVDAVRAPDVVGQPAEPVEVLDRAAAVELDAVRLLLERLREVGVERQPEPARERGRLLHQPPRDRERRARRDRELDARSRAGLVQQRREALRLGEHGVELLDELVRRKAAVGLAEIHRAARGDDPHAELARRLHLRLDQPLAALAGTRSGGRTRSCSPTARARRGPCARPRTRPRRRSATTPGTARAAR